MLVKWKKPRFPVAAIVLFALFLFLALGHLYSFQPLQRDAFKQYLNPTSGQDATAGSEQGNPDLSVQEHGTYPGSDEKGRVANASASGLRFCDKRHDADIGDCVFDIGLNTGQDTREYLASSSSTRVVALEANTILVDDARKEFAEHIKSGRLELLNIGLVGNATVSRQDRPKLEFWINLEHNHFSSFKQTGGCRDPRGRFLEKGDTTYCRKVEMETMSCSELIDDYGTPIYMKIDIEGMDRDCVASLGNVPEKDRPKYISKENVSTRDVQMLGGLGYKKFKVVSQAELQRGISKANEKNGHSGPWGEEADDFWIGKKWHSFQELMDRLPLPATVIIGGKERKGWYDIHAGK